jgi:hypothetical protein
VVIEATEKFLSVVVGVGKVFGWLIDIVLTGRGSEDVFFSLSFLKEMDRSFVISNWDMNGYERVEGEE